MSRNRAAYDKLPESGSNDDDGGVSFRRDKHRGSVWVWLVSALLIAALFGGVAALVYFTTLAKEAAVVPLWSTLTVASVRVHLEALQEIANNASGTRAAGTVGYNRSVEYVLEQLSANASHFFDVEVQPFAPMIYRIQASTLALVQPVPVGLVQSEQWEVVRNSLVANVTAPVTLVAAFGCNATDFDAAAAGKVAVVARQAAGTAGQCDVATAVAAAKTAGCVGVVFVANGISLRVTYNGGNGVMSPIPLVVVVKSLRSAFEATGVTVQITTSALYEPIWTMNVCASSRSGRNDSVVLVGSHLDSVPAGPGINDNGSGSMSNLAVALAAAAANLTFNAQVRHCWWGAEELGLLGSTHYAATRTPEQLAAIALVANFDMLGSPNGVLYIDKVNQNSTTVPEVTKVASLHIEALFEEFFAQVGKPWVPTTIDNPGRSDYAGFLAVGIPAGGLATGAEEEKSVAQQKVFGGLQGAQMDPCYHEACDTIDNINFDYVLTNAQAIAFTVQSLGSHPNVSEWLDSNATLPNVTGVAAALANVADERAFEKTLWT